MSCRVDEGRPFFTSLKRVRPHEQNKETTKPPGWVTVPQSMSFMVNGFIVRFTVRGINVGIDAGSQLSLCFVPDVSKTLHVVETGACGETEKGNALYTCSSKGGHRESLQFHYH